jgi:hypothetical protein
MSYPPLIQMHPDGDYLARGYRRGDNQPLIHCPFCHSQIQAHWQDNGVGMALMDPPRCSQCNAQEGVAEDGTAEWTIKHRQPTSAKEGIK